MQVVWLVKGILESEQMFLSQNAKYLVLRVREVGLGLQSEDHDGLSVILVGRFIFVDESSDVLFERRKGQKNLPLLLVLGDSSVLGTSKSLFSVSHFDELGLLLDDHFILVKRLQLFQELDSLLSDVLVLGLQSDFFGYYFIIGDHRLVLDKLRLYLIGGEIIQSKS